jgi:hypothetical protein
MEGLTVAEDPGSRRQPDLIEPWRQLYQATVGTVSGALANGELDAFGFHQQWLADRQGSGEGRQDAAGKPRDGQVFLRQLAGWTAESARRAAELAALTARLAPRCGELAQELPRKMLSPGLPIDPLDFTLRLYDATSGPLSAMIQEVLTDEAFLQLSRRLLENWATAESLAARLSEDFFHRLQLSTTSDSTRLATLVVGLDEKVDRLDDAVDDVEFGEGARARAAELAGLREQVDRLEEKLDRLLASGPPAGSGTRTASRPRGRRRDADDDGAGRGEAAGNGAGKRKAANR